MAAALAAPVSSLMGARLVSRRASSRRVARRARAAQLLTRAATITIEELQEKYPEGGPVVYVDVDCSMGTNATGIIMKEGPEGRPEVSIVRPGGTAKNKVKVGRGGNQSGKRNANCPAEEGKNASCHSSSVSRSTIVTRLFFSLRGVPRSHFVHGLSHPRARRLTTLGASGLVRVGSLAAGRRRLLGDQLH